MKKDSNTNIIICGTGGQGILLLSDLLGSVALKEGLDIKKSEVHGMAQRGGSVITHLRFGEKVYSPLIEEGTAHFLISLEKLEALRYLHFLSPKGILISDTLEIEPLPALIGEMEYPKDIETRIKERLKKVYFIPAFQVAKELGEPRVQNMVMLGFLSNFFPFKEETYQMAIKELVKEKFWEINFQALEKGKSLAKRR
ncbi:MAG: indolepyruvate oxidoreductase subunit beta [candidate division WOR-3 bacterium]